MTDQHVPGWQESSPAIVARQLASCVVTAPSSLTCFAKTCESSCGSNTLEMCRGGTAEFIIIVYNGEQVQQPHGHGIRNGMQLHPVELDKS